jgi:threonine/homoserine/homoserine lactone efflux protein
MSISFLLTTLVVVATPGTGAVYSIAAGLSRGSRAGIIAAFGCTLGVLPHMVAAVTGLAALLHASAIAFQAIKWLGVAYLLYLAWQTLRVQFQAHLGFTGKLSEHRAHWRDRSVAGRQRH